MKNSLAERHVVAAMFGSRLTAEDAMSKLSPEMFGDDENALLYSAMLGLEQEHQPINIVTLRAELVRRGTLERVGGTAALGELAELYVEDVQSAISEVREAYERRQLLDVAEKIGKAVGEEIRPKKIIQAAERRLLTLLGEERTDPVGVGELLIAAARRVQEISESGSPVTGAPSGWQDLDNWTGGFQPGQVIMVAGRPGMGKTAAGVNMAVSAAMAGRSVAFFSLEMSREEISRRIISSESRIWADRLVGKLPMLQADWPLLTQACSEVEKLRLWIDDSGALTPMELRAKIRRHRARFGCDLAVVDYIGLMRSDSRSESRQVEVSDISRDIKAMAKELKIPVVMLAQLNRGLETRGDKRPMLADLRDSGALEQDSDIVIFIHRPVYYDDEAPAGYAEAIVAKQRDGRTGTVPLSWDERIRRFDTPSLQEKEEWKQWAR